ncbi:MAG: universal stress protein [Pseudonocardiaceae bacterium]
MSDEVVVGVDGSPSSYAGLRWALARAGQTGGGVRAVRCWEPVFATAWEAAVTAAPVPPSAAQEARAERELAAIVAAALGQASDGGKQVVVRCRVARGRPGPVLVAEADGATLLVVGSHGHRPATGLLLGSTSSYCSRHATCPVLVMPRRMAIRRVVGAIAHTTQPVKRSRRPALRRWHRESSAGRTQRVGAP